MYSRKLPALTLVAVIAAERPKLDDFLRRGRVAGNHPSCRNLHGAVENAVFHRHGRIIASVFSPCLRQIAADEFSVRNFVVNALTRVLSQFTAELGEHFRRRERAKSIYVVTAVSGLSIRQKLLEGLVILLLDRKGTGDILGRSTGAYPRPGA